MKKLLVLTFASALLSPLLSDPALACRICSAYTTDGEIRWTCATTSAGSSYCVPTGADCIQSADCCGCSPVPGGGGSCLTPVYQDCLEGPGDEPAKHHMPEFGIFVDPPRTLDSAGGPRILQR